MGPFKPEEIEQLRDEEEDNSPWISGMDTELKSEGQKKTAPPGSAEVECFFKRLEGEILKPLLDEKGSYPANTMPLGIQSVLKQLKDDSRV